jgi:type IV pilus assembly protein PilC
MSNYSYVAVNPQGKETRGTIDVSDQNEALKRIKEMGLFPTKVFGENTRYLNKTRSGRKPRRKPINIWIPGFGRKVGPAVLSTFTRQLATLIEAGMPLLRGLRTLGEQEENRAMKEVINDLSLAIENGGSFAEALAEHPKIFNRLYVNMVKAGEIGGAQEVTLKRLAEFMEKARKIKGKIKAAMFYPCAVLLVAVGIMTMLMVFVVPRFKQIFDGLLNGAKMPAFTLFVLNISEAIRTHALLAASGATVLCALFLMMLHTTWGRWVFDQFKLKVPVLGPVFRKAAISRFARTLGTLVSSGVPILQALTIVKETAGNVIVGDVISTVHENVKQGDPIAPTLKASRVFPAMIAGTVDVGEQTGALPEMLMRIADNYDEEVDNSASAMTSLLEPIMIVILAVIVGSIVIAMFLPLCHMGDIVADPTSGRE